MLEKQPVSSTQNKTYDSKLTLIPALKSIRSSTFFLVQVMKDVRMPGEQLYSQSEGNFILI